eukprot:jgi/Tetstr1/460583/TSEL_000508.t1
MAPALLLIIGIGCNYRYLSTVGTKKNTRSSGDRTMGVDLVKFRLKASEGYLNAGPAIPARAHGSWVGESALIAPTPPLGAKTGQDDNTGSAIYLKGHPSSPDRSAAAVEAADPLRERAFLGLRLCKPGWGGARCSSELPRAECPERGGGCFEHPEYGVLSVPRERWLSGRQRTRGESEAGSIDYALRNKHHRARFHDYAALPAQLGDVAQLAGGPVPLVGDMLASGHRASSVTLLDPHALRYLDPEKAEPSSYYSGNLTAGGVGATSIIPLPPGDQPAPSHRYDTVVMVGALEAVPDALEALERAYHMLRPGGTFVWHERLWDAPPPGAKGPPTAIRLQPAFAQRFTSVFEPLFEPRSSRDVYFIGRKRLHDGLPLPPPQPLPLAGAGTEPRRAAQDVKVTVVLMTHPASKRVEQLRESIERYMRMPIVRHVLLILNGATVPFDLQPFEGKLILKAFARNSMNNRLRVGAEVATEAVLWMDDGEAVEEATVACLYRAWAREPDRVLGLDPKTILYDDLKYGGVDPKDRSYSYVAGKTMLFHHSYLDAYLRDRALVRWVNPEEEETHQGELHFCEDLALAALVTHLSGKAPLAVESAGALSAGDAKDGDVWRNKRSRCILWLEGHFDVMKSPTETRRAVCGAPP